MRKFDKFFIITLVASLIISVATGVPHVRAETAPGNENTTMATADSPTTTQSKVQQQQQQQPVQDDQQQPAQQPIEKQQPTATPNHRPSANAGPDRKINEGANVALDASHSFDPDIENKIIYSWRQIAGRPLVALDSADASIASFTAPDVSRDSTFTFVVSVKDDKGAQDLDTVRVLVKNLDTGTPSTTGNSNGNNNLGSEQTNTNANIKTNPNPIGNTTTRALTNAQKNTGNNIRIDNTSQLQSPTLSTQMARTSAITVQALLTPLQAFPTNGFVNNRAFYDISFQTASSGTIRFVSLTFPAGTQVSQAAVVEVSGIGDGTFSSSGQTMTYTVKSPTTIAAGLTIRLQVDYVLNPPAPSPASGYKIQVTTKDTNGATIDSGSTSGYVIKQIQQQDIGNNQIYSSNIQDGQVATKDIARGAVTPITSVTPAERLDLEPGDNDILLVFCPAGQVVTGGGYLSGDDGKLIVTSSLPNYANPTQGWEVHAMNTDTVTAKTVFAFANCLRLSP